MSKGLEAEFDMSSQTGTIDILRKWYDAAVADIVRDDVFNGPLTCDYGGLVSIMRKSTDPKVLDLADKIERGEVKVTVVDYHMAADQENAPFEVPFKFEYFRKE